MPRNLKSGPIATSIPKTFECVGMTVTVNFGGLEASNAHGTFDQEKSSINIAKTEDRQNVEATFWHEYVHCVLATLGYEKLNKNEKFVERIGQCLYQLDKTKKGEQ